MDEIRGFSKRKAVFLVVSSTLVMFCISGILGAKVLPKYSSDSTYRYLSLFDEVLSLVRYNYVESVDPNEIIVGAYRGAAESMDPYGTYLSPEEMKALSEERSQAPGSIGLEVSKRYGYIVVIASREDSPAWRAGIRSGDYVISVNDRSASDLSVAKAREAFKGAVGSKITLSVIRRASRTGEPEDLELERETLPPVPAESSWHDGVLQIRIRELAAADVSHVQAEAVGLDPGVPLLLDLRDCSNDAFEEAVALADLFLDEGEIVSVKDRREGTRAVEATRGEASISAPVYLLVNRGSAGASEIVASALQHYERGVVLGERTFGRGSVQDVVPLSNGGGLRLSVAKYLDPDGKAIQGRGVAPDHEIAEPKEADDSVDAILLEALEYIRSVDGEGAEAA